jgi:hypothetical protein
VHAGLRELVSSFVVCGISVVVLCSKSVGTAFWMQVESGYNCRGMGSETHAAQAASAGRRERDLRTAQKRAVLGRDFNMWFGLESLELRGVWWSESSTTTSASGVT